nr:lysophospholipid acyltransferase family protein [uncultured Dysosmobacter sp.]
MKPMNGFFVFVYYVVGFLTRILFPTTVEGLEKLPKSGVLLCPNHSSNWDPVLLGTRLPVNYRLHAMAKEELFQNPVLGWIIRKLGAFPVSRGSNDISTVRTAMQVIRDGDNLLIFPEGTVVRNGVGYIDGLPAHAKAGAAMIGVRTGATLVPVFMDGEKKPFRRTRIIFGDPYEPRYTGRRGTSEEMQKIADDILEAAYALGGQAVGGKPLCE